MAKLRKHIRQTFKDESVKILDEILVSLQQMKSAYSKKLNQEIIDKLKLIYDNSVFMESGNVSKLIFTLYRIFSGILEKSIKYTDNNHLIMQYGLNRTKAVLSAEEISGTEIAALVSFCVRIAAGEIIDYELFLNEVKKERSERTKRKNSSNSIYKKINEQELKIKLEKINSLLSVCQDLINREVKIKNEIEVLRRIEDQIKNRELRKVWKNLESETAALESRIVNFQNQIYDLKTHPLSRALANFKKRVETQQKNQKQKIICHIPETEISMDKVVLEVLEELFVLFAGNFMEYGLEPADERIKLGKPENGNYRIECSHGPGCIALKLIDDGRGIDFESVRKQAEELFPKEAAQISSYTQKELSRFLFTKEFTQKEANGLLKNKTGIQYVSENLEKINAEIFVESELGKGTAFTIQVPLWETTYQGFFIKSNNEKYFVPSFSITDVIYVKQNEYVIAQNQKYIVRQDTNIPVYALTSLFDNQQVKKNDTSVVLVAEHNSEMLGIEVDFVQKYTALVMKKLPHAFDYFNILHGICFDETFSIVPILYVPELMRRFKEMRGFEVKKYEAATRKKQKRILIADDSKSARDILNSILKGHDYIVEEAEDGIEALEKCKLEKFDLIISDTKMPRMDGLIFMDNLFRMEQYSGTPVIIVTTEDYLKDQYMDKGAGFFMAKNDFDRNLFIRKIAEYIGE